MLSRFWGTASASTSSTPAASTPSSTDTTRPTTPSSSTASSAPTRAKRTHPTNPAAYNLLVTTGPSKTPSAQIPVRINSHKPTKFQVKSATGVNLNVSLRVLIKDHEGTYGKSNFAQEYFEEVEVHKGLTYSIQFTLEPEDGDGKESGGGEINGKDLLWGNDFDSPIRYNLPPGFGTALNFVKWVIDPGIVDDVYADEPYLFGPLLSSVNYVSISDADSSITTNAKADPNHPPPDLITENMTPLATLTTPPIPNDPKARRKHFLTPSHREAISISPYAGEPGKKRTYSFDFANGFLDFATFSLKLPHFSIPVLKYWDGQGLRYVLKHRYIDGQGEGRDEVLFVVVFMLEEKEKKKEAEGDEGRKDIVKEEEDIKGAEEEIAQLEKLTIKNEEPPVEPTPLATSSSATNDDDID